MRYQLTPIFCRPWQLNGLSMKLIESHYENNHGGALRRLNAITEKLESLDFAKTPSYVINSLKREELVALNSTLLHEFYFASLGGDGKPTEALADVLAGDFQSVDDLHHAIDSGAITRNEIHAELGEIVAGRKPGRQSETETIIFDSSGVALGDVAAALVYERAVELGRGASIRLMD